MSLRGAREGIGRNHRSAAARILRVDRARAPQRFDPLRTETPGGDQDLERIAEVDAQLRGVTARGKPRATLSP